MNADGAENPEIARRKSMVKMAKVEMITRLHDRYLQGYFNGETHLDTRTYFHSMLSLINQTRVVWKVAQ